MRMLIAVFLSVFLAGCTTTYIGLKVSMDNKYICRKPYGTCTIKENDFITEWTINPQNDGTAKIEGKIKANFNDVGQYQTASISILSIKDGIVVGEKPLISNSGDLAKGVPFSSNIPGGFDATAVTCNFKYR